MIPIEAAELIQGACAHFRDGLVELGTARAKMTEIPGTDRAFIGALGMATQVISTAEKALRGAITQAVARQAEVHADPTKGLDQ